MHLISVRQRSTKLNDSVVQLDLHVGRYSTLFWLFSQYTTSCWFRLEHMASFMAIIMSITIVVRILRSFFGSCCLHALLHLWVQSRLRTPVRRRRTHAAHHVFVGESYRTGLLLPLCIATALECWQLAWASADWFPCPVRFSKPSRIKHFFCSVLDRPWVDCDTEWHGILFSQARKFWGTW